MHIHFPRESAASLRDFVLRFVLRGLLIVAGILTALAVEQWRNSRCGLRNRRHATCSFPAAPLTP
jgi:hypothetical protein